MILDVSTKLVATSLEIPDVFFFYHPLLGPDVLVSLKAVARFIHICMRLMLFIPM